MPVEIPEPTFCAVPSDWPECTLFGERVILLPFTESLVRPWYVRWMNDPQVTRYMESRTEFSGEAHTLASLKTYVRRQLATPNVWMFAVLLSSGQHIGNVKLTTNPLHQHGHIGILIGEAECWGHGYATESLRLLRAFAHVSLGLQHVWAGCYSTNLGGIRAFEKAGFQREGTLCRHYRSEGTFVDGVLLGSVWDHAVYAGLSDDRFRRTVTVWGREQEKEA